jgi:hypothetical protein
MRTGSPTSFALARVDHPQRHTRRQDPRTRIVRTFVLTFTTWALFLCYLLVFAV